ncbi:MAG TPA: YHS domain-containing (seleno)protein [Chitinophagaceae bacterium]|nr:YHS domain-containing (seleno)protein [Chitinophagaceae bacterium]
MKKEFLFITALVFISAVSFSQDGTAIRKKHFNLSKSGLAIDGYDPVAYFKSNKAMEGKKEFAINHQGAVYYFSNLNNREAFIRNPEAYEPQYGGWCAYAMGKNGEKVSVDPETFKIVNNKLYLFYNRFFNNTLTAWNKDEDNLKTKADNNWQKTFHQ